jgi:hypothetical protein
LQREGDRDVKTTWRPGRVTARQAPGTVAQRQVPDRDVCRWATIEIRDMTMVEADLALAADPLFHLDCDALLGRVDVRYWYFRPELKYLTCRACSDGGNPSAIEPEAVGCRHRIPTR